MTDIKWRQLTSSTPIFRQASMKLSTFLLHRAIVNLGWKQLTCGFSKIYLQSLLTTAGDGTWILATDRGFIWLARWHRTTPSVNAGARSSGKAIFSRVSIIYTEIVKFLSNKKNKSKLTVLSWFIKSVSSFALSISLLIVKDILSFGTSWFQLIVLFAFTPLTFLLQFVFV